MESLKTQEDTINRLISIYGDTIFRLCYLYVKDYQIAEDIVQEVFVKVYRNYNKFKHNSDEKTWITKIAINTCKTYLKGSWVKRVILKEEIENTFIEDVEKRFIYQDEKAQLLLAVLEMDSKYKDIIILYYYNDLTISEISRILGISENTVKTRMVRGRKKLEIKLKEMVDDGRIGELI